MYLSEIVRAISDLHAIDNGVKSYQIILKKAKKKTIDDYKTQVNDLNNKIAELNKRQNHQKKLKDNYL